MWYNINVTYIYNYLFKMNPHTSQEYISIVWHELRTPLTSIRWYTSMILEWDMWEISDDARKALNHCYDSSVRLIKLVNDVLALSKIESWRMEYYKKNVDITEILKSIYNDMFLEMETKWLDFEINIDKRLKQEKINIDEDRLKQVFINLLSNAIKFTKPGWKIILKATKKDSKVLFEIIDNWIGIEKEKIELLFDKFTQIESSMQRHNTSWLWLWLALCKNFIKDFWSQIKVKSEIWKWSTFYFEIDLINN